MSHIKIMLMAVLFGLSLVHGSAQAQDDAPRRGADRACTRCHHEDNEQMRGKHAEATNPNNLEPVTCTNCHGNISENHRDGADDVMRFVKPTQPLDQRNGICMSCHELDAMRKALWAHDVHANKEACTSCHKLHPEKDPMQAIPAKSRIKLCVDCHGRLHKEAAAKAKGTP